MAIQQTLPAGEFRNGHEAPDEGVFSYASFGVRLAAELGVVRRMVEDGTYPSGEHSTPSNVMEYDKLSAIKKAASEVASTRGDSLEDAEADPMVYLGSIAAELEIPEPDVSDYRPA